MSVFNRYFQKLLLWLFGVGVIANIVYIIWMFKATADFMRQNPDGKNNLGIFLMAYTITLGYLIFYWLILWMMRSIPVDHKWKFPSLVLFVIAFAAPIVWFYTR